MERRWIEFTFIHFLYADNFHKSLPTQLQKIQDTAVDVPSDHTHKTSMRHIYEN